MGNPGYDVPQQVSSHQDAALDGMMTGDADDMKTNYTNGCQMAAFIVWAHHLQMLCVQTETCLDEKLVPFRGRCSFREYMLKKQTNMA